MTALEIHMTEKKGLFDCHRYCYNVDSETDVCLWYSVHIAVTECYFESSMTYDARSTCTFIELCRELTGYVDHTNNDTYYV